MTLKGPVEYYHHYVGVVDYHYYSVVVVAVEVRPVVVVGAYKAQTVPPSRSVLHAP